MKLFSFLLIVCLMSCTKETPVSTLGGGIGSTAGSDTVVITTPPPVVEPYTGLDSNKFQNLLLSGVFYIGAYYDDSNNNLFPEIPDYERDDRYSYDSVAIVVGQMDVVIQENVEKPYRYSIYTDKNQLMLNTLSIDYQPRDFIITQYTDSSFVGKTTINVNRPVYIEYKRLRS